jgi:hypothetical protein
MQPLDITGPSPITAGDILAAIASPAADPTPDGSKPGERYLGVPQDATPEQRGVRRRRAPPQRSSRPPSPGSRRSTISTTARPASKSPAPRFRPPSGAPLCRPRVHSEAQASS